MKREPRKFAKAVRALNRFGPVAVLVLSAILLSSCTELRQPTVEPFYAETTPPPKQELRWSNGKAPKSLDPARATAAPETDLVRAAYEGLTDLDSRSLREIPGVAERWESSEDLRTWTFHLREDAKWSNGERVTAGDFVASWKRLVSLRERSANSYLFQNIVGMESKAAESGPDEPGDFLRQVPADGVISGEMLNENVLLPRSQMSQPPVGQPGPSPTATPQKPVPAPPKFGVEAVDDVTLKVSLELPDKDFPKLVSNPLFRPVYAKGALLDGPQPNPATVTNGAFVISKIADDGITLERSDTYWNRKSIALEQIRFVPTASAEAALNAYRRGEIDVITNASFEPLALKLLAPYEDFRRTIHSALNFYEFNTAKAPFDDRRVREALAISIDRGKLTEGELEGTNQPALGVFPLGERRNETLTLDTVKARDLLEKAGFPDGKNFPLLRLVVNRNDAQQRVARSVIAMWKQNLNIDAVLDVKEASEIENIRQAGDFDLLRRGVVLPTNDELVNIESVTGSAVKEVQKDSVDAVPEERLAGDRPQNSEPADTTGGAVKPAFDGPVIGKQPKIMILTEEDLIYELKIIPLYFPTSYALVKPYIRGFEMNGLDAPSLKEVSIDNDWQPTGGRASCSPFTDSGTGEQVAHPPVSRRSWRMENSDRVKRVDCSRS